MNSDNTENPTQILKTIDLTKVFKSRGGAFAKNAKPVVAVDKVSLEIEKGLAVGILGESGCGKTTLCRLLLALEKPSSGMVFFKGKNLGFLSREALQKLRRQIQVIFQDPQGSLNPRMKVGKAVVEPMIVHGLLPKGESWKDGAKKLFEMVGLAGSLITRFPHELSGGQRQRVCIARALATDPSLLIADEPVASLDISIQTQIISLFSKLFKTTERTLVLISHDVRVVKALCEKVLVMYMGRVVEQGSTMEVVEAPLHPYTRLLINSICSLDPENQNLSEEEIPQPPTPESGCPFWPRCDRKTEKCETTMPTTNEVIPGRYVKCFNPLSYQMPQ